MKARTLAQLPDPVLVPEERVVKGVSDETIIDGSSVSLWLK